jgi:3-mercaptopyruvate sulfurtransferase SseA
MSGNTRSARSVWPLAMVGIGLGLILVVLIWALFFNQAPSTESTLPTATPASQTGTSSLADIPRVSLADAKAAYDQGAAVFVDVRDAQSYAQGHIPGAINIPLDELGSRIKELDPTAWIIPYCT